MTDQSCQPLISIITPTYNHQSYIASCIKSVLRQSYSNWEQIIIDDGSTDDTGKIVCNYKERRIRYERQANAGPFELANSYNHGLSLARGEFVAILEGDDFWPSEKLALAAQAFLDQDVVLAYGEAADVDADGNEQKRKSQSTRSRKKLSRQVLFNDPIGSATQHMLSAQGRSLISPSTVVLRRSELDQIGGFQRVPGLPLTDYPTFIELSVKGRFHYSPQILGYRRRHEESVTVNYARTIHDRVSDFTLDFLASHSERLVLSKSEMTKIEAGWRESKDKLHFVEGRSLLLKEMWTEARKHFLFACRSTSPVVRLAAFAGVMSSCLHTNVEGLMRVGGRSGLRKSVSQGKSAS